MRLLLFRARRPLHVCLDVWFRFVLFPTPLSICAYSATINQSSLRGERKRVTNTHTDFDFEATMQLQEVISNITDCQKNAPKMRGICYSLFVNLFVSLSHSVTANMDINLQSRPTRTSTPKQTPLMEEDTLLPLSPTFSRSPYIPLYLCLQKKKSTPETHISFSSQNI